MTAGQQYPYGQIPPGPGPYGVPQGPPPQPYAPGPAVPYQQPAAPAWNLPPGAGQYAAPHQPGPIPYGPAVHPQPPGPRWGGAPETPEQRRKRMRKIWIFAGIGGVLLAAVITKGIVDPADKVVLGPEKGDCLKALPEREELDSDVDAEEVDCDSYEAAHRVLARLDNARSMADAKEGCRQAAPEADSYVYRSATRGSDGKFGLCLDDLPGLADTTR